MKNILVSPPLWDNQGERVSHKLRRAYGNVCRVGNKKLLSQAEREILIKAVVQAIPAFSMSCFKLPSESLSRYRSSNQKILVGVMEDLRGKSTGLIGILCALQRDKAGWVSETCGNEGVKTNGSYAWRSITQARKVIRDGAVWRISLGHNTNIWGDRWVLGLTTCRISSECHYYPENAKVANLIDQTTSVRSAYHMLMNPEQRLSPSTNPNMTDGGMCWCGSGGSEITKGHAVVALTKRFHLPSTLAMIEALAAIAASSSCIGAQARSSFL
uniref:Uncharacterized protein n=1 Tax=Fagus sylvatica TaxID=28930 RepID=A0A2N9G7I5_FAGSY